MALGELRFMVPVLLTLVTTLELPDVQLPPLQVNDPVVALIPSKNPRPLMVPLMDELFVTFTIWLASPEMPPARFPLVASRLIAPLLMTLTVPVGPAGLWNAWIATTAAVPVAVADSVPLLRTFISPVDVALMA